MAEKIYFNFKSLYQKGYQKLAGKSFTTNDNSMVAQLNAKVEDKIAKLEIGDKFCITDKQLRITKDGDYSGFLVVI